MKSVAEINKQNEEFLNKIIGESAFNEGLEHIPTPDENSSSTIPDSDPADPTVVELEVILSCGEHMKMAFTSSVMEALKQQSSDIKAMVNQLHEMTSYIYADEQLDTIESIIVDVMSNEDLSIPMDKYESIEDRKLRMMFMLHDATHIYTSIQQIISEKDLIDATFQLFLGGNNNIEEENEDENNSAKDNNSESSDGNETE